MRLAVVGSVRFGRSDAESVAKDLIRRVIEKHQPEVVISGGVDGVDSWGEQVAAEFGYTRTNGGMVVYLPKNRRWKPEGFRERNLLIARDCTHLLSIRWHASKTYGSGWTADRAEEFGAEVERRILLDVDAPTLWKV